MKHTIEYPTPTDPEVFPFIVDGIPYEIPRFGDVVGSLGMARRLIDEGIADNDAGRITLIALGMAHDDDKARVRASFDRLSSAQQVEFLGKWGQYTGEELETTGVDASE